MDDDALRRRYDHPVYPCPRCANRSLALKENAPAASFQCFECEARFRGREPHPAAPARGPFPLTGSLGRGEGAISIELSDSILASELFPDEFTPAALRRRYRRELTMRVGCGLLFGVAVLLLLILLIRFVVTGL